MPFPVDIEYIVETERELELEFPNNFKARMINKNGGEVMTSDDEWQLFPFFDKSDRKRLSRTSNHIILETKQARQWNGFPGNGIAIAENGYGDKLILLPFDNNSKKLKEEIYLWLHETGEIQEVAKTIDELKEG